MKTTWLKLHTDFKVGEVDARIFGGFLEHMKRAVYGGILDPDSPLSDDNGLRTDVLEALGELKMSVMRYPGGNFVSGYHWEDGVGPVKERPRVLERAWQTVEPNLFGTDEYIRLCRKMDWAPMITVNLGTGTPQEAGDWVEYCNRKDGSRYADMRISNGCEEPHGVDLWCLGNEMDGEWQIGNLPAHEYAVLARQAGKIMKYTDPSIELVACGSTLMRMETYMEWDRTVLEYLGDLADYISLHQYIKDRKNEDVTDYLAVMSSIDRHIEEMDAACRFVKAKQRSKKRPYLCFDEWNVGKKGFYTLENALVTAGFLQSFIRHADVLKVACIAQIVNVLPPVLTRKDDMLVQSIFYPFQMMSKRREGVSLETIVDGPSYESSDYGTVNYVDASAIFNSGALKVFLTNRSSDQAAPVSIKLANSEIASLESAEILTHSNPTAANTFENKNVLAAESFDGIRIKDGRADCSLPPLSFVAATLNTG